MFDFDISVCVGLMRQDFVVPYQFEDGEENADHHRLVHAWLKHLGKGHFLVLNETQVDLPHVVLDRSIVIDDVRWLCCLGVAQDAAEYANQIPQFHFPNRLVGRVDSPRWQVVGLPRVTLLPFATLVVQKTGYIAIVLVFQQTLDQFISRDIDHLILFAFSWQHHS